MKTRTPGQEPGAHLGNRRRALPLERNEPFPGNRNKLESNRRAVHDEFSIAEPKGTTKKILCESFFFAELKGSAKKVFSGKQKIIGR